MEKVIIGVDPHKLSATIEVVDHHERLASHRPVARHDLERLAHGLAATPLQNYPS